MCTDIAFLESAGYNEQVKQEFAIDKSKGVGMWLLVRSDLGMTKGKIGAQCGHAALGAYK